MAEITYLQAIRDALWEEMESNQDVFLLGEDIGVYGGAFKVTQGLLERFGPKRVLDTPMAETAIVGAAIGAALMGMRPVAEMQFADFISCAFDQLVNFAATNHFRWGEPVPIVVRAPSGGGLRAGPFHSQNPEAWFVHVPGLKVVAPATPYDAKGLLKAAIRDDNPVIYFENKYLYRHEKGEVPEEDYVVPIGVADVKRQGEDITAIAYGAMVRETLAAAEELAGEGIDVEVVDLRSLKPLDRETVLASARKTGKIAIVHEAYRTGGLGGELAALISEEAFEWLDAPLVRITAPDTPVPYSAVLEDAFRPSAGKIVEALQELAAY
ncbi:MAG: alpha-ketoacid dehydrogenase subunit beta [Anaerolineales bacterium]|nr:MAG: alpha-ketoacid dehydrogenase subunit beta [Anaerolineales bacterium]